MKKYKKLSLKKVNIASMNHLKINKGGTNAVTDLCDSKLVCSEDLSIFQTLCCDVRVDESTPEVTCITIEDNCKTKMTRACTI
ncbi:MAG: hypothetical protein AAF611_03845 [Bacteroidota bacterium]